eukprot:TRINITY_DN4642_c0_g1_i1.p1 TRINITY_DN4642_c0_g1~~TRINITY_DN4642_c0_g1_i1.p1  ORF type:complete len:683 (-),score=174.56 TRINITY_DN4642_c0_g1_i1:625-2673(-)
MSSDSSDSSDSTSYEGSSSSEEGASLPSKRRLETEYLQPVSKPLPKVNASAPSKTEKKVVPPLKSALKRPRADSDSEDDDDDVLLKKAKDTGQQHKRQISAKKVASNKKGSDSDSSEDESSSDEDDKKGAAEEMRKRKEADSSQSETSEESDSDETEDEEEERVKEEARQNKKKEEARSNSKKRTAKDQKRDKKAGPPSDRSQPKLNDESSSDEEEEEEEEQRVKEEVLQKKKKGEATSNLRKSTVKDQKTAKPAGSLSLDRPQPKPDENSSSEEGADEEHVKEAARRKKKKEEASSNLKKFTAKALKTEKKADSFSSDRSQRKSKEESSSDEDEDEEECAKKEIRQKKKEELSSNLIKSPTKGKKVEAPAKAMFRKSERERKPAIPSATEQVVSSAAKSNPNTQSQARKAGCVWSEHDEMVLMRAYLDACRRGLQGPLNNKEILDLVSGHLDLHDVSQQQISSKLRRMKLRYLSIQKKISEENIMEDDFAFKSPHEKEVFKLWKEAWGSDPNNDESEEHPPKQTPSPRKEPETPKRERKKAKLSSSANGNLDNEKVKESSTANENAVNEDGTSFSKEEKDKIAVKTVDDYGFRAEFLNFCERAQKNLSCIGVAVRGTGNLGPFGSIYPYRALPALDKDAIKSLEEEWREVQQLELQLFKKKNLLIERECNLYLEKLSLHRE